MIGVVARFFAGGGTWAWYVVAALALALGVQSYRLAAEQRDHADARREFSEQISSLTEAARQAEAAARETERRWSAAFDEVAHDAKQQVDQARADAAAAADVGERLRQRIAELTAACRRPTGTTAAAGSGQAAGAAADLLADVQRRIDEATDRIARHADESRAAGLACERAYGTLTGGR